MSARVIVLVSYVITLFNVIDAQLSIFTVPQPSPPPPPKKDETSITLKPSQVTTTPLQSIFVNPQSPLENNDENENEYKYDYDNYNKNNYDNNNNNYNNNDNDDQNDDNGRIQKAAAYEPSRYDYYYSSSSSQQQEDVSSVFGRGSSVQYSDQYGQYTYDGSDYQIQDQMYSNSHAQYIGTPSSPGFDSQPFLDAHNKHRREHCVGDLTWNENLAQSALEWADQCVFEHSNYGPGENLMYVPYSSIKPEELVDQWVDEKQWYDYNVPYFHESYGHFLQAVWKDTKQLGCASSNCGDFQLVVCHYYPRGNVQGRYAQNVPPPCAQS